MCCTLAKLPVTDFTSDHPFSSMSDRQSPSPQRRKEDTFPLRTAQPSRDTSGEDLELTRRMVDQIQAEKSSDVNRIEEPFIGSRSPSNELQRTGSASPDLDRPRQITPRSDGLQSDIGVHGGSSYAPVNPPSGQVCRYVS